MNKLYKKCYEWCEWIECLDFLPPLIARIVLGYVFVKSGIGKFQNLDSVAGYFASLGIPMASFHAPFVAGVEVVAGALLLVGLCTRLASIPLIITMKVAILTAKWGDIGGVADLFSLSETLYILLLFWLLISGPGRISVDYWWMCHGDGKRSKK